MARYLLKRLFISMILFLGITVIIFILSNLAPGGPADVIASRTEMTKDAYDELIRSMGLDKPVFVRYGLWLLGLLRGDFGISTRTNQSVIDMVGQRVGPSLLLMFTALFLALAISIPLGVKAARRPYSAWDNFSTVLAFLLIKIK